MGVGADGLRGLQAVHARHVQVHQHDVPGLTGGQGQGLLTILGKPHGVSQARENGLHHHAVDLVVLGHQHPQAADSGWLPGQGRLGHLSGGLRHRCRQVCQHWQGRGKHKAAARAHLAGHHDVATHQARQVARDLQPQAGTAKTPGTRFIALGEALKQAGQGGRIHADAGVGDRKRHPGHPVQGGFARRTCHSSRISSRHACRWRGLGPLGRSRFDLHLHPHPAPLRELDGVGRQVEQHLAHAGWVHQHPIREGLIDADAKVKTLELGLRAHQGVHLGQQIAQHQGCGSQRHAPGLQARHVQDVVQQGQQVISR